MVDRENLISPVQVIQILSRKPGTLPRSRPVISDGYPPPGAPLGLVRDYIVRKSEANAKQTSDSLKQAKQYSDETEKLRVRANRVGGTGLRLGSRCVGRARWKR